MVRSRRIGIASLFVFLSVFLTCFPAMAQRADGYIVLLEEPPVALYAGGVAGFAPASPAATGKRKLNRNSRVARAYADHLTLRQDAVLAELRARTRAAIKPSYRYVLTLNGFAAPLTPAQAREAASIPGVDRVLPDGWAAMQTDVGPQWIDADGVWEGAGQDGVPFKGENVVVGIIDSGINQDSPSFADLGGDGYDHDNFRGRYYGVCDPSGEVYDPQYTCNDKLIGMWSFLGDTDDAASPLDFNDHGSHTASTTAGNALTATADGHTTSLTRQISGVAPHANIISYRGLDADGRGKYSWLVACIEQAVADQVDVINYSVGANDPTDPWRQVDALAFHAARAAGVFVAVSAGNAGPDAQTIGVPANAPWLLSVGASSHQRGVFSSLQSMSGGSLPPADMRGVGISGSYGPAPIVYAGDYDDPNDTAGAARLCAEPFPASTFNGEIVVCDYERDTLRTEKGENVLAGGAGGMVFVNFEKWGDSILIDDHVLPATSVSYADGETLKEWLATGADHMAAIGEREVVTDPALGDVMGAFSSRGPNPVVQDVVKPDVSAPGLWILAAVKDNETGYMLLSGTSMAGPHAAGAGALLVGLHPEWTPAEVQSALMTTAVQTVSKTYDGDPADPFDVGAGRIDVARAHRAGLLFAIDDQDYLDADPALGGEPGTLNLPSLGSGRFIQTQRWTRTVTSSLDGPATWSADATAPAGMALSVSPQSFTFAPGESQEVEVFLQVSESTGDAGFDDWHLGSVTFRPSAANAVESYLPLAARRVAYIGPALLQYSDVQPTDVKRVQDLTAREIDLFTADVHGLVPGELHEGEIVQDPTVNAFDHSAGELWFTIEAPEGVTRMVVAITDTTSPDLDLVVFRKGEEVAGSYSVESSEEYIDLRNPQAGAYDVLVQNFIASDPSGATPDAVTAVTGLVTGKSAGNLQVAAGGAGGYIPAEQPFDMVLRWDVDSAHQYWFGEVSLGTSPSSGGDLATVGIDLELRRSGGTPEWLQDLIDAGRP